MQRLPDEAVRLIRSTAVITDVCDIVMALFDNSIDAAATRFRIDVHLDQLTVVAKDNGCGIPESHLQVLGQRYYSTKLASSTSHSYRPETQSIGFRGEALASISQIGVLDVVTRAAGSSQAYRCAIRNERLLFSGKADAERLEGYSTVVKVTNIFASQPVRQRIVSDAEKRVIDNIRSRLQVRSLAYPDIAMQMFKSPGTTSVFSLSPTSSLNLRLAQIYGPAVARHLDFITLDYDGYRLRGSISRAPILGRIQHIFVDGCMWDSPELASVIRSVLSTSDYMSKSNSSDLAEHPNKVRALHPMFVLSISRRTDTDTYSSQVDYRTRSGEFKVTAEIKRLVVLACIKFLRKLSMISDSQMQSVMASAKLAQSLVPTSVGQKRPSDSSHYEHAKQQDAALSSAKRVSAVVTNRRFPIRSSAQRPAHCLPSSYSDQSATKDKADIPIPVADNPWKSSMCTAYRQLPLDIALLEIIGQADSKFIMCKERGQAEWLVAIDQHAADERVRLEASYAELNHTLYEISALSPEQPVTMVEGISVLVPPATAVMSMHNASVLAGLNNRLRMLGIRLSVPELTTPSIPVEGSEVAVQIMCVPSALAPRLARSRNGSDGFAKELLLSVASWFGENRDALLARQSWQSQPSSRTRSSPPAQSCPEDELASLDDAWPMLVGVPTVILDTLKSISCRGAVKFNEQLSRDECRAIVLRLAACRFPGFCAHGRRSVARVATLDRPENA
ncbi:DNA mismatch repair protein [Coemansia erecta]|uniref:DNA mismatch repair protein n=1 Tax=Coemansia erecta TaxID=147472 RepID=A0A9W8CTP5_9FUNG|nr:DNA mismatch repair protein [Coemansia erecta]